MKRFFLPVALTAGVLVIFFVPTLQAQKLKNGNISSLKGLTRVFIADASGSRALADYVQANAEGLVVVDSLQDAEFSLSLSAAYPVADSFNSPARTAAPNKVLADIEGPFTRHPNETNSANVVGQTINLVVIRNVGSDMYKVWSKSATAPLSRSNIPAYTTSTSTALDSSLSGARLSLVNEFLKAYKKIK